MFQRVVHIALICVAAQAAQPHPATLQGHIVRAGSSAAVPHARVVAAKVGGVLADYRSVITGADGRFTFPDLTPGTYRIYATHEGYLQAELGRRSAGASGVPVRLDDGQLSPDFEFRMTPTAVIAGRVNRQGEPVRRALVRALKTTYFNGERGFTSAGWTETDDRGEYRLFGLAPGSYLVSATPHARPHIEGDALVVPVVASNANGNQSTERSRLTLETLDAGAFDPGVYPAVYHPGTTDAGAAQPIEVGAGATVTGIDLSVTPVRPVHVRGRVTVSDADSPSVPPITVSLQWGDAPGALPTASVQTDASGAFDLGGVGPGSYYVAAQSSGQGASSLWDTVRIDVADRDVEGVSIALRRGVRVTGRLTVDGGPPLSSGPSMFVQLQASGGRGSCCSATRVSRDGTFTVDNVTPRDYRFRVSQLGHVPWVKSARFGGEDVLTAPIRIDRDVQGRELEIELSTHTATLDTLVIDGDQRPCSGVLVVAVPAEPFRAQSSAFRMATTGADGRARIDALAPGDYTLFASENVAATDWQDPAVLQRQEGRGTPAHVSEGETRTITLRITS